MDQAGATVAVVKFTGENWTTWKFQVQIILKSKGLFDIVTGLSKRPAHNYEEWDKKNAKAQEIIVTRLEERPLTHMLSCNTSAEMWIKLKTIYEHKSQVSVHLLQQRFFTLEYKEGVAEFVSQLEEIKGQLKQMGEDSSEKMIITKILMSLPENLKHFVSAWESTAIENQTVTELTSRLLIEEERNKQSEQLTALASRSKIINQKKEIICFLCNKPGHMNRNFLKFKNKNKVCNYCKKQGHIMEECWFNKKKKKETENKRNSEEAQALVGVSNLLNCNDIKTLMGNFEISTQDWWLDSGATEHMCFDRSQFKYINQLKEARQVKVGNGCMIDVKGIGSVFTEAWNGKEWIKTELQGVLFVPRLEVNLFSLTAVLDKGFVMHSNKEECKIVDKNNGSSTL